jgi:hypothetical protein
VINCFASSGYLLHILEWFEGIFICLSKTPDQPQNTRKMDTTKEVQFRLSLNVFWLPEDAECRREHILFYSSEFHFTSNSATLRTDNSNTTRKLTISIRLYKVLNQTDIFEAALLSDNGSGENGAFSLILKDSAFASKIYPLLNISKSVK